LSTQSDKEKVVLAALIGAFDDQDSLPSRDEIAAKAALLAPLLGYSGDLQNIITEAETAIPSRMNAGVSLVDVDAAHDEDWIHKREIDTTYADAYGGYLRSQGWKPTVVNTLLNADGSKILGLLQDPTSEGEWKRRGLVIGHVQSGKTANYMGVIAKAADAGYKFIIVMQAFITICASRPSSASMRDLWGVPATRKTASTSVSDWTRATPTLSPSPI
jgi:hypothetical protein